MVFRLEPYRQRLLVQPPLAPDQSGHRYLPHLRLDGWCLLRQHLACEGFSLHEPGDLRMCVQSLTAVILLMPFCQAEDGSQYNQTALLTNGKFDPEKYAELGVSPVLLLHLGFRGYLMSEIITACVLLCYERALLHHLEPFPWRYVHPRLLLALARYQAVP